MPIDPNAALKITQFGGIRDAAPSRSLGPGDAVDAENVWTPDGEISVRPVINYFMDAVTFPVGRTPHLLLRTKALFANSRWWILCVWLLDNGTYYIAVIDNNNGTVQQDHTATPPAGFTWRVGIETFGIMTFVMCGTAANSIKFYYSGGWQKARVGAAAPAVGGGGVTATLQAGGTLTLGTTYYYRVTYYNSVTGTESGTAGFVNATPSVAGTQTIRITWAASGDAQIDQVRIYRKEGSLDDTYYLLATDTDGGSPYDDDGSVTPTKTLDFAVPQFGFDITDSILVCREYKGRMWYAPFTSVGTMVHSEFDKPETVNPLNAYRTSSDASDGISEAIAADGALYVFRRNSINLITGDSPDSFASSPLISNAGCPAPGSIVQVGTRIYFASTATVECLENGSLRPIPPSDPIREHWRQLITPVLTTAAIDSTRGLLIFSVPTSTVTEPASPPPMPSTSTTFKQYVYDYLRDKWYIWDMRVRGVGNAQRNSMLLYPPAVVMENNVSGSANRYRLARLLQENDAIILDYNADPVTWFWRTPDFDFGSSLDKRCYFVTLLREKSANAVVSTSIQLDWYKNQSSSAAGTDTWTEATFPTKAKSKIGSGFDTIGFKLSGTAHEPNRFTMLAMEVEPIGAR